VLRSPVASNEAPDVLPVERSGGLDAGKQKRIAWVKYLLIEFEKNERKESRGARRRG
jgi:hypothetical protein